MSKVKYTNKAKEDLRDIWEYTYETWSENQADIYYEQLILRCEELLLDYKEGKDYSKLIENLKGVRINKHIIFYRIFKGGIIEIERILHQKMDLEKHLND